MDRSRNATRKIRIQNKLNKEKIRYITEGEDVVFERILSKPFNEDSLEITSEKEFDDWERILEPLT